ncbi:KinB-signaling pathway activation protein [Paenibacillus xerothermodurans]|uniref:KinB signaling pathway activation protein n=1 Tax=Paenibacillus xerothermodurans TaxID=1977292 RepID=A0A2W1N5J0_PAEXE|nr:KinB-signaling pathway activation protein [Paenibacillus xerothermodurans]PZE19104.1 KinB signaling pathway activation protein [Paenibacillus xerothermodurans]
MTLRKWFYLFWTTLLVGAVSALIIGLILQANDQQFYFNDGMAIGFNAATMLLGGAMISVLSQMGFFAYLIIRFFAMGLVRSKWIWDIVQILLVLIALFDLIYLRAADEVGHWSAYAILPVAMLCVGVIVALVKVKLTNRNGFIPTLFFMTAVSAIEAVPALRINSSASTMFMMAPLLASNAWQILILSKVLDSKKEPL